MKNLDLDLIKERREQPWREELRKSKKPKERNSVPRVKMPEAPIEERISSLTIEVNQGLTEEQALLEATRCLDCPKPSCMIGCPVEIHIPSFIKFVEAGKYLDAAKIIRETSSLPAVCGRVCPQERQCEAQCVYNAMKKPPVAIGYLERFVADYEREYDQSHPKKAEETHITPQLNGMKVAVVGSGPAGLSFAGDMAKLGYQVNVFEALHDVGGVLKYGIPEYRLPNSVVEAEIQKLRDLGVNFETNTVIGATLSQADLEEMGFDGIFVASGAGLPNFMGIPGENYIGVMSSNEYLTRVNLMHARGLESETPVMLGENVAVIGGGNTAMDSVRTAKRLGAKRAMIIYRRSLEEMPARLEEVHHAMDEGVEFLNLHNPIEYKSDETGRVKTMLLQKMELGEPDASGRRRPVPIEGAIEEIPVDVVVVSIGVSPNPLVPNNFNGLKISPKGTILVNEDNQTDVPKIFAGGDIVRGGATVILAMGDGRKAAAAMDEYLKNKK